ncbi:RepA-like helicase [Mycobacterium phage Thonko]|uniref:RepA-like helicase n=1 Tax=Mycobacterium phage Thonko TaxID=2282910 RepID=A0A346FCA4_9CAUD|nr:DNA polymerase/primase [Mycobacterium phage Thonko]AXN53329.1 RepA-like helicase [Mycobacterium phage Thonko]
MLGSDNPIEAILGSGVNNRDPEAVKAFARQACDAGLHLLLIWPESKVPADMRTPQMKSRHNKAAQEAAREAGRRDWQMVKAPAGLALATADKTTICRYIDRYVDQLSRRYPDGVPINLAVEVGRSRLVVVDCDTAGQMRRWQEVAEIEDIPPTVITPGQRDAEGTMIHSDGGHYYFTVPEGVELPENLGAMTWGGEDGFAVLWRNRYVLIPPSTRPEGAYELVGHVYPLPAWLAEELNKAGHLRAERARRPEDGERNEGLAGEIDKWAEAVSWADILAPLGWSPAPRADSCGCPVWTAPGEHASPKSATAHDTGCTAGRYTEVNAPLHVWTDHDVEPFDKVLDFDHGVRTLSKLQAVAAASFDGNVGKALDALDLMPDTAVEDGLHGDPLAAEGVGDMGDGDFNLPTEVEVTVTDGPTQFCLACQTEAGLFVTDDDGNLWHAADEDDAAETGGHRADEGEVTIAQPKAEPVYDADDLSDLPADFGKPGTGKTAVAADSPYADEVTEHDPDVFDSPHNGVPRIAPFSHWRDLPPPEYIIEGLIEHRGLSSIIGPPGVGKSSVVLDMLCHIATGKSWQGRRVLKTKVLYLPGEGLAGAVQRLRAWEAAHKIDLGADMLLGDSIILAKADNDAWADIAAYIARQGIGLVVFDTFARMSTGLEENSATDVGKAVRRFDRLKELTGAGVAVVHHTGKVGDSGRGSSALNGALDSELLIGHATWDYEALLNAEGRLPGKPIELKVTKQKNIEQLDTPLPLLMMNSASVIEDVTDINAPVITGPSGTIDPMEGDIVFARPVPEPIVETAIRIRAFADNFTQQGITRTDAFHGVKPDAYTAQRADADRAWKLKVAEGIDRALRYNLLATLSGTDSGARYIPSTGTPEQARQAHAAEIMDDSDVD